MANEVELEKMVVRLVGESASYQKMLQQAQRMTADVADKVAEAGKRIEGLGKSVGAFAGGATAALGGITGGLGVTDAFTSFDSAMAYSTSVMGLTEKQTEELRTKVLSMATETGKSAELIAKSFYYMASAGLNAEQSFTALPGFMKFATAGAMDLAQAIDLVSSVMGAARLRSNDANQNLKNLTRTTDVLARASVMAQANIQQFSEALANDAAAAGQAMGKEIEEVTATLAAFSLGGNKGVSAGSDFARMLILLGKAQRENAAIFKEKGIKVFDDTTGEMRNMADIIGDLENHLSTLSPRMKGITLDALGFDSKIQKLFLSSIGLSKNIRQFEGELRKAGGTTSDVSAKVGNTLAASFAKLKNTVTIVAIEIGQFLAPALRFAADMIKGMVKWWLTLSPGVKQATIAFGMFSAVLLGMGPLMKVFSLMAPLITSALGPVKALVGMLFNLPSLWSAISAAVGGVITVISSIAGFVAGLVPMFFSLLNPVKLLSFLFMGLKTIFMGLAGIVGAVFSPFTIGIGLAVAGIAVFIDQMGGIEGAWDAIKKGAADAWGYVKDGWGKFIVWVKPITQALSSFFVTAWGVIKQGVMSLWEWMKGAFTRVKNFIGGIWSDITGDATVNWDVIRTNIRDAIIFAEYILNNFGDVASYVWVNMELGFVQAINNILHFFTDVIPAVLKWFGQNWKDIFNTVWSFTTALIGNLATNIVNIIGNIPALVKGTVKFGDIWTPLLDSFENTIRELPNIPKREMGELEKELLARRDKLGEAIGDSFYAFKQNKIAQFNAKDVLPDKTVDEIGKQAKKAGQSVNNGMTKAAELQKFDAALTNSMEALARVLDFRERNKGASPAAIPVTSPVADSVKRAMDDIVYTASEADAGTGKVIEEAVSTVDKAGKDVSDSMNTFGENVAVGIANFADKAVGRLFDEIQGVERKYGVGQLYSSDPQEAAKQAEAAATQAAIKEIPGVGDVAREAFGRAFGFLLGDAAKQFGLAPGQVPYVESAPGGMTNPTPQGNGPIEQTVAMNPQDSSTQESILDVLKDIKKANEDMLKKPELDIGTAGLA